MMYPQHTTKLKPGFEVLQPVRPGTRMWLRWTILRASPRYIVARRRYQSIKPSQIAVYPQEPGQPGENFLLRNSVSLKMPSDGEGPFLVVGYKGMVLAGTARKWETAYKERMPHPGLHGLDVYEEILNEYFQMNLLQVAKSPPFNLSDILVEDMAMKLRKGGFTIPFLGRMRRHFEYVAKVTGTVSTVPLSMSIRSWAIYWLVECPKGKLIVYSFLVLTSGTRT